MFLNTCLTRLKHLRFVIILAMKQKFINFLTSPPGVFILGALVGAVFFGLVFGFAVVNPTATDWIWHGATHDTAQHFIGWEFFRADSTGGIINGLAHPEGLPITFMDAIPLLALPLKFVAGILPAGFQYFGLWALICYVLMGGLAAILVRKIWAKIFKKVSPWTILFVVAGALIFVLSPMVLARTLYHPALAAHWLILLGILLIWDAPKFTTWWKFTLIWSAMLVGAVLIHPYFLPMLGAMMLVAAILTYQKKFMNFLIKIMIPVALAGATFWTIGGFALGSGAEIRDLHEKGFNLLSFTNPGGYSVIPAYPNASSSPETLMWLGLGVWAMIVASAILWRGKYKKSIKGLKTKFARHKARNIAIAVVSFGLLAFAIGVRVDVGPIAIFQWQPPDKIYEMWSAFRAAAREAWPFYYATILLVIYWFALAIKTKFSSPSKRKNILEIVAIAVCLASLVQLADSWFSQNSTARREGFAKARTTEPEFEPVNISDLVTTQKHLVMLDKGFRGDQSGTYIISQTALQNKLTLNVGFFARIPEPIWKQQKEWRGKIENGSLTADELRDYIFATTDENLVYKLSELDQYKIEQRSKFYFMAKR